MEKNRFIRVISAVSLALFIAACGGAGGGESGIDASVSPSSLTIERRLVADFTDASVLIQPSYLSWLKDAAGKDEGASDTDFQTKQDSEQIDAILFEKWTTKDNMEPALYVTMAFTSAAGGTTGEISNDAIVVDNLVPSISKVQPTSTGQIYFSLSAPLEYNDGQSCALFVVVEDTKIICADSDLTAVEIKGADRSGNLYYVAHKGSDAILRRRSATDGSVLDMTTVGEPWDAIDISPNGNFVARKYKPKGGYSFKKITEAGVVDLDLPVAYSSIYNFTTTSDGQFLFSASKKKDGGNDAHGIYVVPFEGGEPTRLVDMDQAKMGHASFIWDPNGNIWGRSGIVGTGGVLFPVDTSIPFVPVTTGVDGVITAADEAGNEMCLRSYLPENGVTPVYRLVFSAGTVDVQKVTEIPELYVESIIKGRDGRIFFPMVHPVQDFPNTSPSFRLGVLDESGNLKITMPFGEGSGSVYPMR